MSDIGFSQEQLMDRAVKYNGYARLTGIEMLYAKDGLAEARIVLDEKHFNPIGSVHGGCIFTLADSVAGIAVASCGTSATTLSAHSVYLNAAMAGKSKILYGKASPVRVGRKIAVYKVEIKDDNEKEIAEFTFEFFRMSKVPKLPEENVK